MSPNSEMINNIDFVTRAFLTNGELIRRLAKREFNYKTIFLTIMYDVCEDVICLKYIINLYNLVKKIVQI